MIVAPPAFAGAVTAIVAAVVEVAVALVIVGAPAATAGCATELDVVPEPEPTWLVATAV